MKILFTILFFFSIVFSNAQTTITASYVSTTINFSTGLTYVTFAIRNNNSFPVTLTNLSTMEVNLYENNVYTLWYSATSLGGPPSVATPTWSLIATSIQSFTPLAVGYVSPFDCIGLVIPPLTTYRFALQGTKGTAVRSAVTPNIFSSAGVDLLVGNNASTGGTVGYFGWQNTALLGSPYYFDGSITIATSSAYTDLQVSSIVKPVSVCASSSSSISALVCNKSPGNYNFSTSPVNVLFNINGPISQTSSVPIVSGILPPCACLNIALGGVNFSSSGNYNLSATANIVSGPLTDINPLNNSTQDSIINYKPIVNPSIDSICQNSNGALFSGFTASACQTRHKTITVNSLVSSPAPIDGSSDASAGLFAQGSLPALPPGAIITGGKLFVSNLNGSTTGTFGNEARFSIYSSLLGPAFPFLSGQTGSPLNFSVLNFDYAVDVTASQINSMYSLIGTGGTFQVGYWESFDNSAGICDITLNAQSMNTEVQLAIQYTIAPNAKWFTAVVGGSSFYTGSTMNPFVISGSGLASTSTTGTYIFYVACQADTTCRVPVTLKIKPSPMVVQDSMETCETFSSTGNGTFNLTSISSSVSAFNPIASVSYYQDAGLSLLISSPSNYISNAGFIFSKVEEAGCYSSDSVYLEVHTRPKFNSPQVTGSACFPDFIDVSNLIDPFSITTSATDTLFYKDTAFSIPHPNPHAITQIDTVYMLFSTNTNPSCKDSSVAYINVYPANNLIVNQDPLFNFSLPGSIPCSNLNMIDGSQNTLHTTTDCSRIATITDLANGISLGNTSVCEEIDGSVQMHNGQPYVNRHYQISPTMNDSALVCLYYLDDDLQGYNDYVLSAWPNLPTAGNPSLISNLCIAQIHNGDFNTPGHTVTSIPNTAISASYDTVSTVWTFCFKVDSFSYFYLHSQNPLNIPLSVVLSTFTGRHMHDKNILEWTTSHEYHHRYFELERSADGANFSKISDKILSKAIEGNAETDLLYTFEDSNPMQGHNYYRLLQVDMNGHEERSKIIDIYVTNHSSVSMHPNPVDNLLNIELNAERSGLVSLKIFDQCGRTLKVVDMLCNEGLNKTQVDMQSLHDGIYLIEIKGSNGLYFLNTIQKN